MNLKYSLKTRRYNKGMFDYESLQYFKLKKDRDLAVKMSKLLFKTITPNVYINTIPSNAPDFFVVISLL